MVLTSIPWVSHNWRTMFSVFLRRSNVEHTSLRNFGVIFARFGGGDVILGDARVSSAKEDDEVDLLWLDRNDVLVPVLGTGVSENITAFGTWR